MIMSSLALCHRSRSPVHLLHFVIVNNPDHYHYRCRHGHGHHHFPYHHSHNHHYHHFFTCTNLQECLEAKERPFNSSSALETVEFSGDYAEDYFEGFEGFEEPPRSSGDDIDLFEAKRRSRRQVQVKRFRKEIYKF